ncbi:MAG: DUF411 domain-containing protein [Woeseia sp.]
MDDKKTELTPAQAGTSKWSLPTIFAVTLAAFALGFAAPSLQGAQAVADDAEVIVYKTAYCGCCKKWLEQLEATGLSVRAINVDSTAPVQSEVGVPRELRSCHTAKVGDYWVEGHVPPDLVVELLKNKPDNIAGLSVPGMPIGSPGMEGPNPQRYEILHVTTDGKIEVHAVRDGKATAP